MRLIVKVTVAIDSDGTLETHYFCDAAPFKTSPSSTPASYHIQDRLSNPGNIEWTLFEGGRLFGQSTCNGGEIALKSGRRKDAGSATLDAWMSYGISGQPIELWYGDGDQFPGGYTKVWVLYGHQMIADFDTIRIQLRDRSYLLDKPISFGRFAGTGGYEGGPELEGQPKQRYVGRVGYAPVKLVNYAAQLYHVSESYTNPEPGSVAEYIALFENGVEIEQANGGAPFTGDYASFIAIPIYPGECLFWFSEHDGSGDRGMIYVRTGSVPQGELRCTLSGSKCVFDLPQSHCQFHHFAQQAGIDPGLGDGMASVPPLFCGSRLLIDGAETYRDFLSDACKVLCAFFGMTRLDAWFATRFTTPGTPVKTFTKHNSRNWTLRPPLGYPAPLSKVIGEFGETWPCDVNPAAEADIPEVLQRSGPYDRIEGDNSAVLAKHPHAPVHQVTARNGGLREYENPITGNLDVFRSQSFTTPYLSMFGVETLYLTITVPFNAENLALNLLDTVRAERDRMGLDYGVNFRIVRMSMDAASRQITMDLWNGSAALDDGGNSTGGGGGAVDEFWIYGDYPTPPAGPPSFLFP